ncbi:unnamed protein product [Owenia fusiformis]|uniref:Uncharacterized protein n=1 Tax=Owenia fusiformis TaxID=6347 RepID=A0A8S4Q8X0_OWEFU|nr:unnamed protein product [Owenia fusiformis]
MFVNRKKICVILQLLLSTSIIFIFIVIVHVKKSFSLVSMDKVTPVKDAFGFVNDGHHFNKSTNANTNNVGSFNLDLRIIVITYNRPVSLLRCLKSLNDVDYIGHRVKLDIFIDRSSKSKAVSQITYSIAKAFSFLHGKKTVNVHKKHVGLYGQWLETWRPTEDNKEIAVILEDDITVSPFFYEWLRAAHAQYDARTDVSGYALANVNQLAAAPGGIVVPLNYTAYIYPILGSWGFSPHRDRWREFLAWYDSASIDASFNPYVKGIRHTEWYESFQKTNYQKSMWSMWHIYFSHIHKLYCVFPNLPDHYMFARNHQDRGFHYSGNVKADQVDKLVSNLNWNPDILKMPKNPIKVDYYGHISVG